MNATTSPTGAPRFDLPEDKPLIDEVVHVRLLGLPPDTLVNLRARTRDDAGQRWESRNAFVSDADGTIDLTTQAPVNGTYEGVDPMGFVWSMRPEAGPASPRPFARGTLEPSTIELIAEVDGAPIATGELTRLSVAPGVRRTPIREHGLVATLFQPAAQQPTPVIVVLGGSGGGIPENLAALFASHGYTALALAYFGAEQLPPALLNIPLEYFATAFAWLKSQPFAESQRLALCGTSRGGELALLLATRHPEVNAVVAYVPSGVIFGAVTQERGPDQALRAAWTERATALPFLTQVRHELLEAQADGSIAMAPAYLQSLRDVERARASTIPVERIRGPVLLISGQDDAMWPSAVFSDLIMERLAEHLHPYPDRHLTYAGTGHMIGPPYNPTTVKVSYHSVRRARFDLGGTPNGTATAQADSWPQVLRFLGEQLREQ